MTSLPVLLLAIASLVMQGCVQIDPVLKFEGPGFQGLAHRLSANQSVKVLVVHGMGMHDATHAGTLIENLSKNLGLQRNDKCQPLLEPISHPGFKGVNYGSVNLCKYLKERGPLVSFYVLTWSPLTDVFKQLYLSYDWTDPKYTDDRLYANKMLKEKLVDQSLSDPILYVGPFKPHMQYPIQQAICLMMNGAVVDKGVCSLPRFFSSDGQQEDPIFIISSSLGSTMAYDTVQSLQKKTHALTAQKDEFSAAAEKFAGTTVMIFMLANQLPLLRLGDISTPQPPNPRAMTTDPPLPESLEFFIDLRQQYLQKSKALIMRAEPLAFVAFSDPNDLLSYPIPKTFTHGPTGSVSFTNVILTIVKEGLLGKAANPYTAHTGYAEDETVIRLISCGNEKNAPC